MQPGSTRLTHTCNGVFMHADSKQYSGAPNTAIIGQQPELNTSNTSPTAAATPTLLLVSGCVMGSNLPADLLLVIENPHDPMYQKLENHGSIVPMGSCRIHAISNMALLTCSLPRPGRLPPHLPSLARDTCHEILNTQAHAPWSSISTEQLSVHLTS